MPRLDDLRILYDRYKKEFSDGEIVLGDGDPDARLLLVGEAPGKDEVKQGRPFVGAAGKNLSEFLKVLGLKREDIYITNAIKYRLSEISKKTNNKVNRPAKAFDIARNERYLLEEIKMIAPQLIDTLGNVPLRMVSQDYKISIGDFHGKVFEADILERIFKVFPLYHPASIIYNRALKETYDADLSALKLLIYEEKNDK